MWATGCVGCGLWSTVVNAASTQAIIAAPWSRDAFDSIPAHTISAPATLPTMQLNMPEDEVAETIRTFRKSHLSELQVLAQIRWGWACNC